MIFGQERYRAGWQYVRDTLTVKNKDVAWFAKKAGIDTGLFYYYMNDKHEPKMLTFVAICQTLSLVNGKKWEENARIIVENDYKRGDLLL